MRRKMQWKKRDEASNPVLEMGPSPRFLTAGFQAARRWRWSPFGLAALLLVACTDSDPSDPEPAGGSERPRAVAPSDALPETKAESPAPEPEVVVSEERREAVARAIEASNELRKAGKIENALAVLAEEQARGPLPTDLASQLLFQRGQVLFFQANEAGKQEDPGDLAAQYGAAASVLQEVLQRFPGEDRAASARYLLGSTRLMVGDLDAALQGYQKAFDDYPEFQNRARALLRVGVCQAGLGETDRARATFRRVIAEFPDRASDGKKATKYLAELSMVGRPAPALPAQEWLMGLAAGRGLATFEGEVVVVIFFATWCENCSEELPALKRLITKWGAEGTVFLGVANPEDPKNTLPVDVYVQKNQIPFHDVALDRKWGAWRPYRVQTLPAAALIDRRGVVRWRGHPNFFPTPLLGRILKES